MTKEQERKYNKWLLLIGWIVVVGAVVIGTMMWTVWAPEKVLVNVVHTAVLVPVIGYMGVKLEEFRKEIKEIENE